MEYLGNEELLKQPKTAFMADAIGTGDRHLSVTLLSS